MLNFVINRVLQLVPVIIGVTLATFLLAQIIPGDPADVLLGSGASEEARQELRLALGLDRPIWIQYAQYLGNLLQGNLGQSFTFAQPVSEVIAERLVNTALLSFAAIILATAVGILAGTWVALKPGAARDQSLSVVVLFFNSMPSFWLGLVLIIIFGLDLQLLPVGGMADPTGDGGLLDIAAHMILPTVTLAAWSLAVIARMTRASMLDVLNSDFIRTARSRGVSEMRIVLRHALPNALPAVITVIGLQMGFLLSGAVLTETVFSWPGLGLAMYQAISTRDIPLIQGGILVLAISFVLINFFVDVLYAYFNPKIELS
ncbi:MULTISPECIES: ABC transporter permease [unclassified Chelatococcus]|uniref:ABC transporter permease n=1 Tax=unclassified Chelatococcus TaxID=2638111 RepID=UPI001BD021EA|nr:MULTISPECIES: ABC transporter permease [unclassified Chelatococcus]MBS7700548.1 ABC transporter permease [Chelatococcus sp. YT9]MBX3558663.1 ABC transporter permease [Chelatococcus sp.]